jgi:hypothetical protein
MRAHRHTPGHTQTKKEKGPREFHWVKRHRDVEWKDSLLTRNTPKLANTDIAYSSGWPTSLFLLDDESAVMTPDSMCLVVESASSSGFAFHGEKVPYN